MCRVRGFGALSPTWNGFIRPFPSRPRDLCRREGKKIVRSQKGWISPRKHSVFQKKQDWCTYELTEKTARTGPDRFKPTRVPALRWGRGPGLPPLTKKVLQLIPTGKGKSGFLQWNLPRCISHVSGQALRPGVVG